MRKAVCGCFAFFKPQVPGSNAFLLGQLSSPLNGVYFVEVSQLSYHSCGTSIAHASEALIHRTVPSPVPYHYHALYGGVHNVPSVSCSHITAKCSRCYITKVVLYFFGCFSPCWRTVWLDAGVTDHRALCTYIQFCPSLHPREVRTVVQTRRRGLLWEWVGYGASAPRLTSHQ